MSPEPDRIERRLQRFFDLCESPRTRERALALVRASASNSTSGRRFYTFVSRLVRNPVGRSLGMDASAVRLELVAAQLLGVATMRYVLEVEPVASMSVQDLVAKLAPSVRALLADDLVEGSGWSPVEAEWDPGIDAEADHLATLVQLYPL
ncbi:TetR/AcrR family transcriptional regulator [Nocardioides limicola]|uniref:TetR/AcrR family transcriptional regulator n=1 Tax=Nocardioides limicola TaxID=2803368 RepID=UPI00193C0042|nr:hypothetical protein [Nocardioides sp. DJM-14]